MTRATFKQGIRQRTSRSGGRKLAGIAERLRPAPALRNRNAWFAGPGSSA